ncbi:MAG: zinc ABC transporter solute-binding protein [Synechococcaceae cyanobacterium SM2_3_2]|nr:zinc ABC transporter solute-binding protein [Synechococcaceae cyanobacterium SM2_3_2]
MRFNVMKTVFSTRQVTQLTLGLFTTSLLGFFSYSESGSVQAQAGDPLQVVTTILPITQFTRAVAGDRAEVTPLMPTNVGPHDFQARPEEVRILSQADVLVINGLEIETFLEGLIANAGNPGLLTIDSSDGIATMEGDHEHSNDHDHEHSEEHSHDHEHSDDHSHDHGHVHGEFNPHIWLDPKRAIQQVENIRDGLISLDPEGQAIYQANAAAYIEELQALDQEISAQLNPFQGKTFVVFHDFAPYFAESYGLKAEFLIEIPEENPAPEDVRRVIEAVRESGLQTILTEPQAGDSNPFEVLATDLEVEVRVFDPIETSGPEGIEPDYYLTIMRQNVENLVSAFESEMAFFPTPLPPVALGSIERPLVLSR